MLLQFFSSARQERIEPGQPASGHGGGAVAPAGTGQYGERRGTGGLHEIMRRLADALLRVGQAGARPHRPAQPGAGLGDRRPHAFHQPAEHHHVDRLQPRLEQAPDENARMLDEGVAATQGAAAAHHLAFQHRIEQRRQRAARLIRQ